MIQIRRVLRGVWEDSQLFLTKLQIAQIEKIVIYKNRQNSAIHSLELGNKNDKTVSRYS